MDKDFARMNAVYEKLMPTPKPARSCVQVAKNPGDVRIEIECVAKAP
jgi:enamine deaminase RidA (YjgF/YER057c/UK114 family)